MVWLLRRLYAEEKAFTIIPFGRLKSYSLKAADQKGIIAKAFSSAYSLLRSQTIEDYEIYMIFNMESNCKRIFCCLKGIIINISTHIN